METLATTDDLGRRVDALRSDKGVTVQQLAAETQIPFTTLQRRLAGDGRLTVTELRRISAALHVTPASWFESAA
jgi:transcriptional regulator with XRE-family HTH domain